MSKVITGLVRMSYAHVWEPNAMENQEPKYSVSLIIDKSDKKTIDAINKAVEEEVAAFKLKNGGKLPKKFKMPLRDGDEEREDDENYVGKYFVNASSKNKPGIVDKNRDPLMDKEEFYSGCYGHASVNFYSFNVAGNAGVACGLNNLMKVKDGDRLSGGASAQEDFADFEADDLD